MGSFISKTYEVFCKLQPRVDKLTIQPFQESTETYSLEINDLPNNDCTCIILAAGFGERLRPLTNIIPKPLAKINSKSLIEYHLDGLYKLNCSNILITTHWLGNLIENKFKNIQLEYKIKYSNEEKILGSAGGIKNALKIIKIKDYFIVINGDIFIPNFDYEDLFLDINRLRERKEENIILAYLYLVPNPCHNLMGDFYLKNGVIKYDNDDVAFGNKYTFSGIAIYHIDLFQKLEENKYYNLLPLLKNTINENKVNGKLYNGIWYDVGNIKILNELNQKYS
jgi:MurNAc alpha-1-phosphate uridylyltransferase